MTLLDQALRPPLTANSDWNAHTITSFSKLQLAAKHLVCSDCAKQHNLLLIELCMGKQASGYAL